MDDEKHVSLPELTVATAFATLDTARYNSVGELTQPLIKRIETVKKLLSSESLPMLIARAYEHECKIAGKGFSAEKKRWQIDYTIENDVFGTFTSTAYSLPIDDDTEKMLRRNFEKLAVGDKVTLLLTSLNHEKVCVWIKN